MHFSQYLKEVVESLFSYAIDHLLHILIEHLLVTFHYASALRCYLDNSLSGIFRVGLFCYYLLFFILICAVLVVTQVWLELKMPDYTQKLTELVSSGNADMDAVLQNGGKMLLCAVLSMGAAIVCGFFASHVAANFARTLRIRLFDRITNFGDSEINRFSTPSLITRTTNDVVQLQMLIAIGLQVMIKAPVMAV